MLNHKFKKKYGQNFLNDENIIKKIVFTVNVEKNSLIIEIGPGSGMLTKNLDKIGKVIAYEVDIELENALDDLMLKNTNIIFDDFLKRDIKNDLINYNYNKLYVVANLPYYITTPIINKIINDKLDLEKIVIMVQKEVGERFAAAPNSKDYGSITVFLNYYFDIKKEFVVSRNVFIPKPNVDSIVISLTRKKNRPFLKNEALFFSLIRDSFQFKRKTIRNNLKKYNLSIVEKTLIESGFTLNTRAEELPLSVFVDLSNNL